MAWAWPGHDFSKSNVPNRFDKGIRKAKSNRKSSVFVTVIKGFERGPGGSWATFHVLQNCPYGPFEKN